MAADREDHAPLAERHAVGGREEVRLAVRRVLIRGQRAVVVVVGVQRAITGAFEAGNMAPAGLFDQVSLISSVALEPRRAFKPVETSDAPSYRKS